MRITRQELAQKLIDYLHHRITLAGLVDWAEMAMMEADFQETMENSESPPSGDFETVRDIVSKLGLADVRAFGITWEDCEGFLSELGYRVSVTVSEVPAMASARE
jgi:hypothetical protein